MRAVDELLEQLHSDTERALDNLTIEELEEQFGCEIKSPTCKNGTIEWLWECFGCKCTFRCCDECRLFIIQEADSSSPISTVCCGLTGARWQNVSRGSFRTHARLVRAVRTVTCRYAKLYQVPALERCTVALTWYVLTPHRRDAVNLTDTLKAMQDGLVDAGVVSDDTPDLMNAPMPAVIRVDPMKHRAAWMELVITRWDGA